MISKIGACKFSLIPSVPISMLKSTSCEFPINFALILNSSDTKSRFWTIRTYTWPSYIYETFEIDVNGEIRWWKSIQYQNWIFTYHIVTIHASIFTIFVKRTIWLTVYDISGFGFLLIYIDCRCCLFHGNWKVQDLSICLCIQSHHLNINQRMLHSDGYIGLRWNFSMTSFSRPNYPVIPINNSHNRR